MPATATRPTDLDVLERMLADPTLTVAEARRELGLDGGAEPRDSPADRG